MFTLSFIPQGEHSLFIEEWRGKQRISPPGHNFTLIGDRIHSSGIMSYLGFKVFP
jgi:hypothetical protein